MKVNFEGQVYNFPDDATDQEITEFFGQKSAPAPEPVEALNSRQESVPMTIGALFSGANSGWEGLKAVGGYLGEKYIAPVLDAVIPAPSENALDADYAQSWTDKDRAIVEGDRQRQNRAAGSTLGEMLTPQPVDAAMSIAGGGWLARGLSQLRNAITEGAGAGLTQAGKALARTRPTTGDLTDLAADQATAGLIRRNMEKPGATGGLRDPEDPKIVEDTFKQGRRLASGALVRPSEEAPRVIATAPSKSTPTPKAPPAEAKNKVIDPFANGADRDIPGVTVTGGRQGTTYGSSPLPSGELKTAKEIVGEAGSRKVRATPHPAADVPPSVVAPEAAIANPAIILDETAARLAQRTEGIPATDPRLPQLKEALDLAGIGDSKKKAALRGVIGALTGGVGSAGASEGGESDDALMRRIVYMLLGAGLGVAAYPAARRVIAAWRGRALPKVDLPIPNKAAANLASGAAHVGGDLKSAAEIALETYGSVPRPKPNPIIEAALQASPPPPPPATLIPILDVGTAQKVAKFAESLFVEGKFKYVPGDVPMTDQMLILLRDGFAGPQVINAALKNAGMTHAELLHVLQGSRGSLSESARWMAQFSQAARNIQKALAKDPAARTPANLLTRIGWGTHDFLYGVMSLWRGFLTSHIATAMRNAEVSLGRGGLGVMDGVIEAGLRRVTGAAKTDPLEGLELWGRMWQYGDTKKIAEEVLKTKPSQWRKLYGDLLEAEAYARGSKVGEAIQLLNWHNAMQERFFRNVAFTTALDRELRLRGMDLEKLIQTGQTTAIPIDAIQKAVDEGLGYTMARSPEFGEWWWHTNKALHQWWAVPFVPFPRFLYNSFKFYMEYSPMGFLHAVRGGGYQSAAKAATGTALLGAAIMFRDSNLAGEKWYQAKTFSDHTIDLRPFNPLAGYLFMGEAIRRLVRGEMPMPMREMVEGIVGLNLRAGTGFAFMDSFIDAMSQYGTEDFWTQYKWKTGLSDVAGEWLGGFATPLQQFTDLIDQFTPAPYKAERKQNRITDPFLARLPGANHLLAPAINPLHQETPQRHATALRFLGISVEGPRTAAEKEFQRMNMAPGYVLPKSGIIEWDRHAARYMAIAVDNIVDPFVQSPGYQNLDYKNRMLALRQVVGAAREIATEFAAQSNPELAGKAEINKMPALQRRILIDLFGPKPVENPGAREVVRFMRSSLPNYAKFLQDIANSIKEK